LEEDALSVEESTEEYDFVDSTPLEEAYESTEDDSSEPRGSSEEEALVEMDFLTGLGIICGWICARIGSRGCRNII